MNTYKLLKYILFEDNIIEDGKITTKKQAYLFYVYSHLWFIIALYGIYMNKYINSLVPFSVGCASLTYWNNPTYGMRRNIDMAMTVFGTVCVSYNIYNSPFWSIYVPIKVSGYIIYFMSCYFHKLGYIGIGTLLHMIVHLCGHTGCVLMFNTSN
jgi:uncharacterized RDD family membrane protein YckC